MHHLTWKSRKFSFQAIQLIILLTIIVTSNAGALRAKRETSDQHGTTTPSSKIVTESNLINMDTTELEQLPAIADPDAAIDIDTEPSPIFAKSVGTAEGDAAPKTVASQSKNYANSNDFATEAFPTTTTVEYVAPSSVYATTLSSNENVTEITTGQTATTTTTGSTRIIAAMTPKPAGSLLLTTLLQKLDTLESTTETETTAKPFLTPEDVSQVVTVRSNETEENITNITTDSSIDSKTMPTTTINEETTTIAESMVDVNTSRLPTDTNQETTSPDRLEDTTIQSENIEITTTSLNPDVTSMELQTTTGLYVDSINQSISDTTTIRDANQAEITTTDAVMTTMEETTKKSVVESEVDKVNYDVAINEIKNNTLNEDHAILNRESEPRNKYVSGGEKPKEQIETTTAAGITSTSLKTKTTKSHKFVESAEVLKTNDVESLKSSNYTFTSTGTGAANSIENTLEAGQIDDSVLNKKENKSNAPRIPEMNQAMKMISSTPTISDILIPSTPSIERNRVEDIEEVSLKSRFNFDGSDQLTTTEKVQNSIASSIEPSTNKDNKTTEEPVDTTTKRIERSTSEPAVATTMTQKAMNITTVSSFVPLSAMPIERESESTTVAADEYMEPKRGVPTTTEQHNIDADNKFLTTSVGIAASPDTTSSSLTSNSVATIESSETNAIVTSTVGSETSRIATTVSSTTPTQSIKQLPTKPKMKPVITKETPSPAMNVTHIVSTEPIEEYSIQSRANQSKEPSNPQIFSSPSMPSTATTSTEFPGTETTEKVTTNEPKGETDYNVIIAISVSIVGIVALILLVGFLYVMRKRQKSISYGQRCRPVSLDAYSLDNVSIFNSVRRKGALRASKRSYGNAAFDDPSLKHNSMSIHELAKFVERKMTIHEEFKDVPQIIARPDEVPAGCEDKNRYANVIPLPETRVILSRIGDDEKTEYINANFARGPKDPANYYIACQAPLESTVSDFWRMIWEQNSRVIIMATDLIENGVEKCAEYLPASMTLDNYAVYGDYQITLKSREVKDKYAVSTLHVKNIPLNRWREIIHFWYKWPETGVPSDEASVIAMLLEARSYLKMGTPEQSEDDVDKLNADANGASGSLDKTKSLTKNQGPLTVHCSPGTGRTGTIITCDIALRSLEMPKRIIDIPQFVYYVRRGRASAVQTKEQYEFIYKVAHMYATKISGPINDN